MKSILLKLVLNYSHLRLDVLMDFSLEISLLPAYSTGRAFFQTPQAASSGT